MTLVQWGLYFHASQVVDAAAQDAARAAQTAGDPSGAAAAAAGDVLAPATSSGLLHNTEVDVEVGQAEVAVAVTAEVRSLVPFPLDLSVRGRAGGPMERFVAEPDRP